MVGFMDKDFDGKLSWTELPGYLQKRLANNFERADVDGDGGLSIKEMYQLQKMRQQRAAGAL